MRSLIRWLFAFAGVAMLFGPASADDGKPPPGAGRYVLSAARDGFVRLDTVTGAVSHCSQQAGAWHCDNLAGEDLSPLAARLDALSDEVAKLSVTLAALESRVADIAQMPPIHVPVAAAPPGAPVAEAQPVRGGIAGKAVLRLAAMIRALKRGGQGNPG